MHYVNIIIGKHALGLGPREHGMIARVRLPADITADQLAERLAMHAVRECNVVEKQCVPPLPEPLSAQAKAALAVERSRLRVNPDLRSGDERSP